MEGEHGSDGRRRLDQMSSTGISYDFRNEFTNIQTALLSGEILPAQLILKNLRNKVKRKGYLIARYEQRYPSENFVVETPEHAKPRLQILNRLADECNVLFSALDASAMSEEEKIEAIKVNIIPKIYEMEKLIQGKDVFDPEFEKYLKKEKN